jgi:pyruvate formate lyase activating enzyme
MIKGFVNSLQSLGASDGPGVRFVVFLQGCNLHCGCCHNPETQGAGGTETRGDELLNKVVRFREYFGSEGGITLSGGEPLLQAAFAREVFCLCKNEGINTCLDTSGSVWNEDVASLLEVTDHVLLDIKYTNDEDYRTFAGCDMERVLTFLGELDKRGIPTTLRQVIIPTLNDNEDNISRLREIKNAHACVEKIELLPFKKMCSVKYDNLGREFPFAHLPTPTAEQMNELNELLK